MNSVNKDTDNQISIGRTAAKVKQQVVAGCIVYRETESGTRFLLLYRRGGYWNFPKGHFEIGEDALQTALRETEEETGIASNDLKVSQNFQTRVRFNFKAGEEEIHDTVILYLAKTNQFHIHLREREHSGSAWFSYRDAMRILGRYQGTKRALTDAYNYLSREAGKSDQLNLSTSRQNIKRQPSNTGNRGNDRRPYFHSRYRGQHRPGFNRFSSQSSRGSN